MSGVAIGLLLTSLIVILVVYKGARGILRFQEEARYDTPIEKEEAQLLTDDDAELDWGYVRAQRQY